MAYGSNPSGAKAETRSEAKSWLKPEQVDALRDAALSSDVPTYLQARDETLVAVLADTGLRRSEAAAINVDWLDLDAEPAVLDLPAEPQKGPNASPATLSLAPETARQVRRYLSSRWKDSEALFPSRQSDRMTGRSVNNRIQRLAELAGVEPFLVEGGRGAPSDVSSHTLRHSVAYRMVRVEEKRLEDVKMRLRHRYLSTTDRVYGHLVPR
jgi:integrase